MRKALSFVLVLTLVLSSFSMAFAADTTTSAGLSDIAGNANEAAIQVSYDLGIVTGNPDGTFLPAKAVTRAEFAAMITRALAIPDSALAGYTATSFKDTAGYSWAVPYLAFCQSKGIMLGDGAGNVMPGRTINTNEAVTMVLRAIGYTSNSAELVGVWPANYVTKAQDLGIYDDVAAVVSVDKANAAQIIYNALTVNKVQVATDGTTSTLTTTMLTAGLDCSKTDRIVNYGEDAVININEYVGAYATVYLNSSDEIVAVKEKSDFLTGKFNAAFTKFTVDGEDYNVTATTPVTYGGIENSDATTAAGLALNSGNYDSSVTYTIAADLSGKTIKGIYTVMEWVADADEVVDSGIQDEIADNKILGIDFYEDDDDAIDVSTFSLVGVDSLSKIAKDNVVYVYENNANKVVKVEVGTETVEGTVTAFNTDDGAKINGKYYDNSAIAANALAAGNVSDVVKAYLDANGEVYDFDVTEGNADNYAVVTKTTATSGFDKIIKLIDKDGTNKSYTWDDDVAPAAGTPAVGEIILFSLDSDGVIDAYDSTPASVKTNDACVGVVGGQLTVETAKVLKIGTASYAISSDVVVFTYDGATTASATGFDIAKITDVDDTAITSSTAVYFNSDGVVTAILVPADNASNASDDLYGVVNTKELTVNADNDKVYQLVGFANGAALDKLTTSESKGTAINSNVTAINLYKFGVDADGAISEVTALQPYYEAAGILTNTALAMTSNTGIVVNTSGDGYITASTAAIGTLAIADNAKFYQVKYDGTDVDEYSVFTGTIREGYKVWVYETDDDEAGYDIVVVLK